MIPPKKNPIDWHEDSLRVLNDFRDFVSNMPVPITESSKFKQDAIKLIESLKFIKLNLEFIGYVVENKTNPDIYACEDDFAMGVIRDFKGTSLHVNAYHNKEEAQTAFANLVQQFENAIVAMQSLGRLEIFARQLQYDKNIGCVEARVSKALLFATASMSSPAHCLDQLMAQCQFMPNDDATALMSKAKIFFKSYMGQACIWKNKDYLIDAGIIKQYLIEVFGIESLSLSEEVEDIKNLFDGFTLAEKIKFLQSPLPLHSYEVGALLLEEIDKINKRENFTYKQQLKFFEKTYCVYYEKFFYDYLFPLSLGVLTLLAISGFILGLIFLPELVLGLTIFFFITLLVFGVCNEESTKFEILIGSLTIVTLPLSLAVLVTILTLSIIVNGLVAAVACLFGKSSQLFLPNQHLLFSQCIDDYFVGKTDLPAPPVVGLLKCYLQEKSELTEKETAFLEAMQLGEKNIVFNEMNAAEIWLNGLKSWHHYRFLRKNGDIETQWALDTLLINNRLFEGLDIPFQPMPWFQNQKIEDYFNVAYEKVVEFVLNNQVLAKVIKPKDWSIFIDQLTNLNHRAELRKRILNPTHKFVHLTGEIIAYRNREKSRKLSGADYTHTKKTSTTLLSSQRNTPLFGTYHRKALNLVGFLFDQKKCKIKARLLQNSKTYEHGWLGSELEVMAYQTWIQDCNVINEDAFIRNIQETDRTNEVLAKLNKEALMAIVIGQDTPEARHLAISRQTEINEKFSLLLPIVFYDSAQRTIKLFAWQDLLKDKSLQQKKRNLMKLKKACLKKDWEVGFFGGEKDIISEKSVPQTVAYLKSKLKPLEDPDKVNDFYSWALAEQEIKNKFKQKCKQNRFFRILKGRSRDTLEFYQNSLRALG